MRLGADDREPPTRKVEQRGPVGSSTRWRSTLARVARAEATAAEPVLRQPADDRDLRPLFARAAAAGRAATRRSSWRSPSTTSSGTPLAWAGRPSELSVTPRAEPAGSGRSPARRPALFVAPGPLGFRLVRVEPVMAGTATPQPGSGRGGRRAHLLGARQPSATRRPSSSASTPRSRRCRCETSFEGAGRPRWARTASSSRRRRARRWSRPTSTRPSLDQARREHRAVVFCLVIAVLGLTLLLLVGPVLDLRATGADDVAPTWRRPLAAVAGGRRPGLLAVALPPGPRRGAVARRLPLVAPRPARPGIRRISC